MLSRLDKERFRAIHFSPMFKGGVEEEEIDGVLYLRKGGIFSVIWYAMRFYKKNKNKIDFVVDQCNTHRFFTKFWVEKKKRIFYIHQLCRELWNIMLPPPFSWVGKMMETPMLKLNKDDITITVSESTKRDLIKVGYDDKKIYIVPNGLNFKEKQYSELAYKSEDPIYIYVGRFVPYKGANVAIEAFGKIKEKYPKAKLWLVGRANDEFVETYLIPVANRFGLSFGNEEENDVVLWGFVDENIKLELQEKATALLFPAQREGWGIIVLEAGAMGTPSIVYNSPGCIDAVNYGKAGYLCKCNDATELVRLMQDAVDKPDEYEKIRHAAYNYCTSFKWEKNVKIFEKLLLDLQQKNARKIIEELKDECKNTQMENDM